MKKQDETSEQVNDFRYEEAIKTLRTNIRLSGSEIRKILITSSEPNEGKSTIAVELARSFADTGERVCFIDADIRKSEFVSRYQVKGKTVGLSQILSGQVNIEDAIYCFENMPNIDIILSGPYAPNPTELFEDKMCAELFKYLDAQHYDAIVIDTPPIGTVIDAAILCKYVDGVAFVCRSGETSRRVFKKSLDQLNRTGARCLGVILNGVNMTKGGYYHRYYGYGKYGDSYSYYYKHKDK